MIPKFSIKKPLTVVVMIIIIAILGVVSYTGMQEDLLPDMNLPYLIVVTIYPGAQPDTVEQEITIPLEEAFASVSNINALNSVSSEHYSMIIMELKSGSDLNSVKRDLEDAMNLTALPTDDLRQDPIIIKLDPSMLPIMTLSIGYDANTNDERTEFLENVIEKIQSVEGVASVSENGLISNYAYLNTDVSKAATYLTNEITGRFDIDIHISDETKEEIRVALLDLLKKAENDPSLQTDSRLDPEKILDALLDELESVGNGNDAVETVINSLFLQQLRPEGSPRTAAISLIKEAIANRYIIEDGEENKKIFYSLWDNLTETSITNLIGVSMQSTLSALSEDVFKQLFYAQDFEYPAMNTISSGASGYVVKVGDKIGNREEFMNVPIITLDLATYAQEYISQIELILRLFSATVENGKINLSDSSLHALAKALSYTAETIPDDFGKWAVDTLSSNNKYSPYYVSEETKAIWAEILNSEYKDDEQTLPNELFTLISSWEKVPYNWRTQILDCIKDNDLYPVGTTISEAIFWDEEYTNYYSSELLHKYENILQSRPSAGNVEAYADYILSQTTVAEENKTLWKNTLILDSNFQDMVAEVSSSDTLDWQLCALRCVIQNQIYPSDWSLVTILSVNVSLITALNNKNVGRPNNAETLARLAINGVAVGDKNQAFYLDSDIKEAWISKVATDEEFLQAYTDMSENDAYMLVAYRFLNKNAELYGEDTEKLLFPIGIAIKDATVWGEEENALFDSQIDAVKVPFSAMENTQKQIIDSIGQDNYDNLIAFFMGRTEEQNYNFFVSVLKMAGEILGEGTVTKQEIDGNEIYVIDIKAIQTSLQDKKEDLKVTIKLKNLCDVTIIDDLSKQITKLILGNGEIVPNSIQLSIDKEPTAPSAEVTKGIKQVLEEVAEQNEKFSYTVLSDDGEVIGYMLSTVVSSLLIGGILALIILIFFLKDIKATLVIGSSIVISVVVAIILMYFTGISLNVISLGGLTLGIGMLVDNSVVVLENTYRLRSKGYTVMQSAAQGANQMLPAIFGSTITTIIVFIPVLFVEGIVKEIFIDFALTICYSLGASLLVSMTVVPAAYNTFMAPRPIKNPSSAWGKFRNSKFGKMLISDGTQSEGKFAIKFKKVYLKALNFVLNHKILAIILVVVLFGGSILAAFSIGTEYFPDTYMGYISVTIDINAEEINSRNAGLTYDNDSYLTYEDIEQEVVDDLVDIFAGYSDINSVGISRASGIAVGGMSLGSGAITATVTLVDEKERSMSARDFVNELDYAINKKGGNLFTAEVDMYSLSSMMDIGAGSQSVYVYGNDYSQIQQQAKILAEKFADIEGVYSVDSGIEEADKEYKLIVDKDKANKYGLTVGQVYLQVSSALGKPSKIHELTLATDNGTEKMSVMVYNQDYLAKYWYVGKDGKNRDVKVYFKNNASEDGSNPLDEYFVKNTSLDTVYVKHNGNIIAVGADGNIPVVRENDTVSYEYAKINEKSANHDISYEKVTYSFSPEKKYYSTLKADTDLLLLSINSENLLDSSAPTKTVPLYQLLSGDCFVSDSNGNVIYRQSNTDERIPVGIKLVDGYTSISHIQYRKCVTMTVLYDENISSDKIKGEVNSIIADYNNTKPYSIEATTESNGGFMDNVFNDLYKILIMAIVLVFLVMVAQFQSWKSPLIIMATILFAFTGSFFLMALTATKISIMSLVGLIVLMGVVVNNGIVFVDYANSLVERGLSRREALLKAGNDRLRPILMTAITTILGMLAMALDSSDYGAMLQPLAIAMIGGLTYATLMTLFIVPSLYDIFNRKSSKRAERAIAFKNAKLDFEEDGSEGDGALFSYIKTLAEKQKRNRKKSSAVTATVAENNDTHNSYPIDDTVSDTLTAETTVENTVENIVQIKQNTVAESTHTDEKTSVAENTQINETRLNEETTTEPTVTQNEEIEDAKEETSSQENPIDDKESLQNVDSKSIYKAIIKKLYNK